MPIRRLAAPVSAVLALTVLAGCAAADPPPTRGTETRAIVVDGVERSYRVHVPASLDDDPALVVMLHGGFGSGAQAQRAYGWDGIADERGIVVAYPDGVSRTWNAGDCCGPAARDGVEDVAFLTALVAHLQSEFDIPPTRTFGTGMSNGAMMTYRVACETELFAAIAPVAGTVVTSCPEPRGIPVMHVHGMLDSTVPFAGGPGDGPGRVDGMPVPDAVEVFRAVGGCAPPVVTEAPPVRTEHSTCTVGDVALVTIADAGHQWPGSVPREGAEDPPSTALDATTLIADFFGI